MKIRQVLTGSVALAAFAVCAESAFADNAMVPSLPSAGHFSVTPDVGTAFTVGGDFVKSGSQSVVANGVVFGATVSGTFTASVKSHSFNDVYDKPLDFGLSGNYGLTGNDEVSAHVSYMHASGKSFDALDASASGTINGTPVAASGSLQGQFSNYNEVGLDGEYKHFFDVNAGAFHPYLGGLLGVKHNNSVSLDLSAGGTPVLSGIGFYNAGWSWSAGLQTGFRYDIASSVALGLETGIRYEGNLSQDSTDINAGTAGGLANVNNGGSRWDIPVMAGVTVKF